MMKKCFAQLISHWITITIHQLPTEIDSFYLPQSHPSQIFAETLKPKLTQIISTTHKMPIVACFPPDKIRICGTDGDGGFCLTSFDNNWKMCLSSDLRKATHSRNASACFCTIVFPSLSSSLFISLSALPTPVIYVFACSSMTWNEIFSLSRALIMMKREHLLASPHRYAFNGIRFSIHLLLLNGIHSQSQCTNTHASVRRIHTIHTHHTNSICTHKDSIWKWEWLTNAKYHEISVEIKVSTHSTHTHTLKQANWKWMRHNMTCGVDNTDYLVIG